jgi:hypothetical protein
MTDKAIRASAWAAYDRMVLEEAATPTPRSAEFSTRGVHFSQLSSELAAETRSVVENAEVVPFRIGDFTPGFVTADFPVEVENSLNETSKFRHFDTRATWVIGDMLDSLKDEVAACLGTPWKVLNIRSWSTRPQSEVMGPYAWHSDGFVDEIFKVMVYLTPLSVETGAIEFEIDGSVVQHKSPTEGAWALFKNSAIKHRGVAGTIQERLAIEVTLCRAVAFDIRPRFPGLNAHWPEFPWIDALDGCSSDAAQMINGHRETIKIAKVSSIRRTAAKLTRSLAKRKKKLFG